MRKINKITYILLTLFLVIGFMPVHTYAGNKTQSYQLIFEDGANLLSESEASRVREAMKPITEKANVVFYTSRSGRGQTQESQCHSFVSSYFGSSKKTSVVMFFIDMANREIYVYCEGKMSHVIRNGDAYTITDNVYRYATRGDYDGCAVEAFHEIYALADGYLIRRPMKIINNALIALFLGFLLNYFWLVFARRRYKRKFAHDLQTDLGTTKLKVQNEIVHVKTKYYTESDGSSGGFSGGGGGGGGGGSSSGGGHSF